MKWEISPDTQARALQYLTEYGDLAKFHQARHPSRLRSFGQAFYDALSNTDQTLLFEAGMSTEFNDSDSMIGSAVTYLRVCR